MRAMQYRRETRRNPDTGLVETIAVVAVIGVGVWAISQQFRGFAAAGQGIANALGAAGQGAGSALGNTGQAAGATASAIGTGASNAASGVGGAVGSFFSGLGGDINARIANPSESALAAQWRRSAAANAGGSDPNDWQAFRNFTFAIGAPDPGPTPFAGWPDAYGGSVLNVTTQQYE